VTTDARPQFDAIKAALDVECTADVYGYDKVPGTNQNAGTTPANFVLLSVERRYNPMLNLAAMSGTTGWRAGVRGVGLTIASVELLLSQAATALNHQRLTIGDGQTTPFQFESGQAAAWDDGRYSGLAFYTFAL